MIRICLAGATGWVGKALVPAIEGEPDLELAAAVSRKAAGRLLPEALGFPAPQVRVRATVAEALETPCDALIDFTSPDSAKGNVLEAVRRGVPAVIGTSGLMEDDFAEIEAAARQKSVGVLAVGNFAITAVLLERFAEMAARSLEHWEILEFSSESKPDAPSGTARQLAARLSRVRPPSVGVPIGETRGAREARGATFAGTQIHSVRVPGFVSSIEVLFGQSGERLSIRHDAGAGAGPYVAGTLAAVRRVATFTGLRRGLDSVLDV